MKSSSSSSAVSFAEKLVYNVKLLALRLRGSNTNRIASDLLAEVSRTAALYEEHTGRRAADAAVLEIGFGARPYRALAMASIFGSVIAIDLDEPASRLSQIPAVWQRNGPERAIKTAIRLALFDIREMQEVRRTIERLAGTGKRATPMLLQANAADTAFWSERAGAFDLIVSDDVFEHIPPDDVALVTQHIRRGLKLSGLAIIRPFVFNGVSGGHDIEAYPSNLHRLDRGRAWRHVWDSAFRVNTYLNKLSRRAFRDIFSEHFIVARDESLMPTLGRDLMDERTRAKLEGLDDYELYSNKVEFVLTAKSA